MRLLCNIRIIPDAFFHDISSEIRITISILMRDYPICNHCILRKRSRVPS